MSANTNTGTQAALSVKKSEVAEKTNNTVQNLKETAQAKIEQVGNKAEDYKGKVSESVSGVAGKVHEKSDTAQEYLGTKAEKLNEFAHTAMGKVNRYGHKAADALDNSSVYLKNLDFAEAAQNLKTGIKQRPGTGIVIAGIFGLLIGLMIGKSR